MLQVAPSFASKDGEHAGSQSKRSWAEYALKWIAPDGQLFVWEKLPFSPPSWRCAKARSSTSSDSPSEEELDDGGPDVKHHCQEDAAMDAQIWSSLPEDVMEKVLACLPLTSVVRFRSVCRRWNSVLLSHTFVSSHSENSPHRPCFLLCTIGPLACSFDPSLSKWLTFLKPCTSPANSSVIASTGSLFCLGNQVAECRVLSICNPITRSFKQLPPMQKLSLIHKITATIDFKSSDSPSPSSSSSSSNYSYIIVVAGEDGMPTPNPAHTFNLMTEIYHSSTNSWSTASDPPPHAKFGSDPGAWCNGRFYCLTEMPYGVVMFHPNTGSWEEIEVAMPAALSTPSLVAIAKNRLLMVGRTSCTATSRQTPSMSTPTSMNHGRQGSCANNPEMKQRNHSTAICIWELVPHVGQQGRGPEYRWVEIMRMPSGICKKFLEPLASYSPFVCAGVGSTIYITTHLSPQVLVYDMGAGSWAWLPSDPLFPKNRDFHLLGFVFEPRFDACP